MRTRALNRKIERLGRTVDVSNKRRHKPSSCRSHCIKAFLRSEFRKARSEGKEG